MQPCFLRDVEKRLSQKLVYNSCGTLIWVKNIPVKIESGLTGIFGTYIIFNDPTVLSLGRLENYGSKNFLSLVSSELFTTALNGLIKNELFSTYTFFFQDTWGNELPLKLLISRMLTFYSTYVLFHPRSFSPMFFFANAPFPSRLLRSG